MLDVIAGFGVAVLAVGALGYAIRRHRENVKWAAIREKQVERLKWLKRKMEK